VAFALRDAPEALVDDGVAIGTVRLVGGGTDDPGWRTLLATALGRPLHLQWMRDVSVLGAARLAAEALGGVVPAAHGATDVVIGPDPTAADEVEAAWHRWRQRRPT